jgi:hypothetical protein
MTALKSNFGLTNVDIFKYMQLKHFLSQKVDLKYFGDEKHLEGILFESE